MKKVLGALGILMLAQVLFVGLVHVFLRAQGKDSPETLEALHAMPVVGGFFFPPPPEEPPLTTEERREMRARRQLEESRGFFELPPGFTRERMEELFRTVADARARYEARLQEMEEEKAGLETMRAEFLTEQQRLESRAAELTSQARNLQAGREELDLRSNRLEAAELQNLKASMAIYEQMPADGAAAVLRDLNDVDTVAKLLKQMSPRKSGKILAAMETPLAVQVTRRMQAITPVGEPSGKAK